MDKRLLQALLITFVFLLVYSHFTSKYFPAQKNQPLPEKSISEKTNLKELQELPPLVPELSQEEAQKATTVGKFEVTYSLRGGYLKNIFIPESLDCLPFQNIGFIFEDKDKEFKAEVQEDRIIFLSPSGRRKEYIFKGYTLRIKMSEASPLLLFSMPQSKGLWEEKYQEFFFSQNKIIERRPFKKVNAADNENVEFAGARSRYWCLSLLRGAYNLKWLKQNREVSLFLTSSADETSLYLGPQTEKDLQPFGLQGVIDYGFFHAIAIAILKLLHFFYFLTKSWGASIVLLSIVIYIILFPLTYKSSKGMKEMKDFQKVHREEIDKIREKYKDTPHKIHQATMELYKKYGFNPLKGCASGCLPLFLQLPVIFAFWNVAPRAFELKGAHFLWIKDLSLPDQAFHLPFELPFLGSWINVLPILTSVIMFVQMKFSSPEMDPEQAQQQKMLASIFPIMMGVFTYQFPAALLLYWFVNSLLTFISQWKMMKAK